ncbi:MAG: YqeG family HAD IIIA-type phosphatase [Vulcanibacillus sp.]
MRLADFAPNLHVKSIYDIDLIALKEAGITSIITDLDNTLVEANSPTYTPKLVKWLDDLQEQGFKVIIVSNNNKTRVSEFADPLTVPYIHKAMKPFGSPYRRALEKIGSSVKETVVIGDQLLTDIYGGKRLGFYTILVTPISKREGKGTRINRKIERIILPLLKKRGLFTWED